MPEVLELKEIEHLRDYVRATRGQIEIKFFPRTGRDCYALTYDSQKDDAVYLKFTACNGDQSETVEETWGCQKIVVNMLTFTRLSGLSTVLTGNGVGRPWSSPLEAA